MVLQGCSARPRRRQLHACMLLPEIAPLSDVHLPLPFTLHACSRRLSPCACLERIQPVVPAGNASQCGAEFPIPATATLCIDGRGEVGQNLEHAVELFQSGTHGPAGPLAHLGASLPQLWESASQMRPATAPCSVPTLRHRVTRMLRPSWASATRKASGARLTRRWEVSCPLLNRPSPLNLGAFDAPCVKHGSAVPRFELCGRQCNALRGETRPLRAPHSAVFWYAKAAQQGHSAASWMSHALLACRSSCAAVAPELRSSAEPRRKAHWADLCLEPRSAELARRT